MRKQEFLAGLRDGLSGLPQDEVEERLTFYSEMLDDRMEEGLSEEDAVAAVGCVDEIVRQIIADTPFTKIAKERIRPKRQLKAWEIVLLVLGAPIWVSLGIAAAAIISAVYVSFWAVMAALWAVFGALAVCPVGGVLGCILSAINGSTAAGLAVLAVGMVCAGLAIFLFFGCRAATGAILRLTKDIAAWAKSRFLRKEDNQ